MARVPQSRRMSLRFDDESKISTNPPSQTHADKAGGIATAIFAVGSIKEATVKQAKPTQPP